MGIHWLLRRLEICQNAYDNYRKHPKADDYAQKSEVMAQIEDIYHSHNGVDGYRNMTVYLAHMGYNYSPATLHKYMNTKLGLHSMSVRKNPIINMGY